MITLALAVAIVCVAILLGATAYTLAKREAPLRHTYTQRIDVSNIQTFIAGYPKIPNTPPNVAAQRLFDALCAEQDKVIAERRARELEEHAHYIFCTSPTAPLEAVNVASPKIIYNDVMWGDLNTPNAVCMDTGRRLEEPAPEPEPEPEVWLDAGVRCHNGATYKPRR